MMMRLSNIEVFNKELKQKILEVETWKQKIDFSKNTRVKVSGDYIKKILEL